MRLTTLLSTKFAGLKEALRARWDRIAYSVLNKHPIARIPWSAVRRIGQSRLLALTVIVPFLGSVIVFNQTVVEALALSPELVRRWLHLSSETQEQLSAATHALTLSRLYYVYFGLSFLGFGSAVFALFCPITIKDHSSITGYQSDESPFASKPKFRVMLREIAREACYWDWTSEDEQPFWFASPVWLRRAGEPSDFQILFHVVMLEIYVAWCRNNPDNELDHEVFEDRRGHPDTSKLAYAIAFPNRMQSIFVDELADAAFDIGTRNDVLALSFMANDNSKPVLRLCAAACYAAGFCLLLVPTAQTFCSILRSLIVHG